MKLFINTPLTLKIEIMTAKNIELKVNSTPNIYRIFITAP